MTVKINGRQVNMKLDESEYQVLARAASEAGKRPSSYAKDIVMAVLLEDAASHGEIDGGGDHAAA